MADELRVVVEVGKGERRTVAGATDWPGLDRWGKTEESGVETLAAYVPRYAAIAERAGMGDELARQAGQLEVVERTPGNSSTDFWGIAHVPSEFEREGLSEADLDRRLRILEACWAFFDDALARASAELRSGPRGGGWPRDVLERHVYLNEPKQMTRKVEVRTPFDMALDPAGRAEHRQQTLGAIRAYHAAGKPARTWPIAFLIRRIAHHLTDHGWELEDRSSPSPD